MELILTAAAIFICVFSYDYWLSLRSPQAFQYVSHETLWRYGAVTCAVFALFHVTLGSFLANQWLTELVFITILFGIALVLAFLMKRNGLNICSVIPRASKCISPAYVVVKSLEILLQLTLILLIAIGVSREIGTDSWGYISFGLVLALVTVPLVFQVKPQLRLPYFLIVLFLSVIFFYIFTVIQLFWPAAYVVALCYVFVWLALAEPSP